MPRGPRGEKRPADVIGNAVKVMRIATGEVDRAVLEFLKSEALRPADFTIREDGCDPAWPAD